MTISIRTIQLKPTLRSRILRRVNLISPATMAIRVSNHPTQLLESKMIQMSNKWIQMLNKIAQTPSMRMLREAARVSFKRFLMIFSGK